jgi:hypothetical protein
VSEWQFGPWRLIIQVPCHDYFTLTCWGPTPGKLSSEHSP